LDAVGAEQTATGYEVAWRDGPAPSIFDLDHGQQRQPTFYSDMSGTSIGLESLETAFHQD